MILLAAVALNAFVSAFGGAWTCTPDGAATHVRSTHWEIGSQPHGPWTRVTFSPQSDGGTALVGYVPYEKAWLYQDFHDDGSYSDNRSPGPDHGIWTWTGAYYAGTHLEHYAVQWRRDGATIRRSFGVLVGTSFRPRAGDVCRR